MIVKDNDDKFDSQRETERLIINPPTESDFENFFRLHSCPKVMRYVGTGKPRTKEVVWDQLKKSITHYHSHGFTLGSVFEKATPVATHNGLSPSGGNCWDQFAVFPEMLVAVFVTKS